MSGSSTGLLGVEGYRCVVTGGGRGIGAAIVSRLCEGGASVIVNDIDEASARRTANDVRALGFEAGHCGGDASTESGAEEIMDAVSESLGYIDLLVNNAAGASGVAPFIDGQPSDWVTDLSCLHAALRCTHAALPGMVNRSFGRIVNVTSIGGVHGGAGMAVYCGAKGAIHSFSAALAKEVAGTGVTVNCVAPGTIDTPRQRSRDPEVQADRRARIPMGRFGTPNEVAAAVLYFASRDAAYTTGEVLLVDGGRP